ncbi:MAG TPA: cupin domain-containing protein [Thermodesulfobacteriota bacterium]|nr:cupin domain-containing protein [Thermodesulfobacteriota bacterium]
MGAIKRSELTPEVIGPGRTRYLAHTDNLMIVAYEFNDGPASEPDPPHVHPHEQVACVVSGEILFFMDGKPTRLGPGDLYTVPPNVPHTIQLLTRQVRIVDAFTPIRKDFLK